jgi:hypothetical protein
MTFRTLFAATAALAIGPAALAQDAAIDFRLAAVPGNIQGCIAMDSAFTRVHTITIKGDSAEIKSAGGIDDKMKMVRPGVYETTFRLSGAQIDIVADTASTPKTLTVTSKNLGCKWTGVPAR